MENILDKLIKMTPSDTKLGDQILYMETLNSIMVSPMTVSILNSLKELRGIKQNQLEKLKTKN